MARRTSARVVASSSSTPAIVRGSPAIPQLASTSSPQLLELRKQWKWAAFSQFFFTFAALIALEDVTLVDVENDLVDSTMDVIPRLMHRLLITLSQDRKITVDNWQSALRRQYLKRDPQANPIGSEPPRESRATSVDSDNKAEQIDEVVMDESRADNDAATRVNIRDNQEDTESANNLEEHAVLPSESEVGQDGEKMIQPENISADTHRLIAEEREEQGTYSEFEQSKDWASLSMLEKLNSLHIVTEWHFQTPLRLRQIMRSDDDNASWRIEPIGYDAKYNAYWLIGADRLWIQRRPPKLSKKSTKRKAPETPTGRRAKVPRVAQVMEAGAAASASSRGKGSARQSDATSRASSMAASRNAKSGPSRSVSLSRQANLADSTASPGSTGRSRAAKTQANVKLDLQAKQLAAAKAEFESFNRRPSRNTAARPESPGRPLGTRVSRRLRGNWTDDEWQQIPAEWLSGSEDSKTTASASGKKTRQQAIRQQPSRKRARPEILSDVLDEGRTGLSSGDDSELTELSDFESNTFGLDGGMMNDIAFEQDEDRVETDVSKSESRPANICRPIDFVEWETICVTLQDWDEVAQRFEKSTNYLEKALHKILTQDIVPVIAEALQEAERQRLREEALMNRKRSSRIAIKETEKEAARLEAIKQAEEEEKMARIRRLEARTRKEEEDRLKREQERERRRKEREERELARTKRRERSPSPEKAEKVPSSQKHHFLVADTIHGRNALEVSVKTPRRPRKLGKQKSSGEDWELDCEICGSKGINRDEDVPLMCCGKCNKWQHIPCHDAVDAKAGRPKRNWDDVDFTCERCSTTHSSTATSGYNNSRWQYDQHQIPYTIGTSSSLPSYYTTTTHTSSSYVPPHGYNQTSGSFPSTNGQQKLTNYSYHSYTPKANGSHDVIPATSKKTSYPSQASVTFAHYQPLQRGFSPLPTTLQSHGQHYASVHPPHSLPGVTSNQSPNQWNVRSGGTTHYRHAPIVNGSQSISPLPAGTAPYAAHTNGSMLPQNAQRSQQSLPPVQPHHNTQSHAVYQYTVHPATGAQPYYHPRA